MRIISRISLFYLLAVLCCGSLVAGTTTVINGTVMDTGGARYILGTSSFNLLIITNGGILRNGFADIGELAGNQGNQAIVTGLNSLWASGATLTIGVEGADNAVTVTQGGTITVAAPYGIVIGSFPTSTGNGLSILNGGNVSAPSLEARNGNVLLSNGSLGVSSLTANENGSTFTFASGSLSTMSGFSINNDPNPFAIGTTPGGTSTWNVGGGNNVIAATNGFILGDAVGSTNIINISGQGAILSTSGSLYLGNNGISSGRSSITLLAGTSLQANNIVGALDHSSGITNIGGAFQFTTSGPTISNAAPGSIIGSNAIVSFLNVTNAPVSITSGALTNISFLGSRGLWLSNSTNEPTGDFAFQSVNPTNYDNLELVGGTNQWNGSNLTIGPGGRMLISNCVPTVLPNGGRLTIAANSTLVYDGDRNNFNSLSSNLTIVVTGTNAQWHNQRFFTFGSSGGNNLFIITNGGSLITTNNDPTDENLYFYDFSMGYYGTSGSNVLIATGPGTLWNNAGQVDVGVGSSGDEAYVLNGATAIANCSLGGSNNNLTVSGDGTTWYGSAYVGGVGDTLEVSDGANAQVGMIMIGYNYGQIDNLMSIDGGNVSADTVNIGFYGEGDLSLNRGSLSVNWFYQNQGNFYFNGGIVNAMYSEVNYVVGDGLQPARLNLTGSFHKGAIIVSTNSYLTGVAPFVTTGYGLGAIQNVVTSYGTIMPGNPIGEMCILSPGLTLEPSSTLIFNLQGTNQGFSYSFLPMNGGVQFGGNLRIRLLNGFTPSSNDTYTVMTYAFSSGAFANVAPGGRIKTTDNLGSFQVDDTGLALVLSDYQTTDTDGDGIDDSWALQNFGHTPLTDAEKQADSDGSGLSNYQDFLAGTSPNDPASTFKITSVSIGARGAVTLQFNAVAGKTYQINYSDDLKSWNTLGTPLFAWVAPGTCQWVDDGTETGTFPMTKRFYRVTVGP